MIRSLTRSAVVLLGAVALVGGLAGQVPAAATDQTTPVVQTAAFQPYDHGGHHGDSDKDGCADDHERKFRGGEYCDDNTGYYCSYGYDDDYYYAYDHGRRGCCGRDYRRHDRCRDYYYDDYYYDRYYYYDRDRDHDHDGDGRNGRGDGDGDGHNGRGDGDGHNGRGDGDRGGRGDGDGGGRGDGDGGGNGGGKGGDD